MKDDTLAHRHVQDMNRGTWGLYLDPLDSMNVLCHRAFEVEFSNRSKFKHLGQVPMSPVGPAIVKQTPMVDFVQQLQELPIFSP